MLVARSGTESEAGLLRAKPDQPYLPYRHMAMSGDVFIKHSDRFRGLGRKGLSASNLNVMGFCTTKTPLELIRKQGLVRPCSAGSPPGAIIKIC